MADAPIPVEIQRLATIRAYRNEEYIARQVLPTVSIGYRNATYRTAPKEQLFQVPDTRLDRKGVANEIEFVGDREPIRLVGYGLSDRVPNSDVSEQAEGEDVLGNAAVSVAELLELGREVRTAGIVMNPATYPTDQQEVLSGADQWSDPSSDPIGDIKAAIREMFVRPNLMVMGIEVHDMLVEHPKILERLQRVIPSAGGIVTDQMLATLFGVPRLLIGAAHVLTSKKGQDPTFMRAWGKSLALLYIDPNFSSTSSRASFGATFERGARGIAYRPLGPGECGTDGGTMVTLTETVGETIMAPDLGFLFSDVVA